MMREMETWLSDSRVSNNSVSGENLCNISACRVHWIAYTVSLISQQVKELFLFC